jgi:hypothetical protein
MPRYKHYDYNQTSMVVINFEEPCLPLALKGEPGTFEYALHHLITDRLDLTPFDELYSNDGKAGLRPEYDPAILLKSFCFLIPKASPPAARFSGVASTILFLKRYPAILSRISPPLPLSSVVIRWRLNTCSNRCCWSANRKSTRHKQIPASEFDFDPTKNTCVCPEGNS